MMRILFISGYTHPAHHRKVELLANAPDADILHINQPDCGKTPGWYPSADGMRQYRIAIAPIRSLGQPGDPHRTIHFPPNLQIARFRPHLIHCEHEQESLMAAEVALLRAVLAPRAPLVLYAWQNILRQRRRAVRWLSNSTLRAAQHIMCASAKAAHVLRQQGFAGSTSIMPLFGLDTRFIAPRVEAGRTLRTEFGLSGVTVGYCGRLVPEKGIDSLIRAFAAAPSVANLLIIGTGPDEPLLRSLARDLDISQRCTFTGAVEYDRIADYLSALDILVLPSRTTPHWKEQYGRVLVEAMACQVAVVGSATGAIPEVIGDAGRLFAEGDTSALTLILEELARQPAQRDLLCARGYQRALECFTVEQLAAQILTIWRGLV